MQNLIKRAFYVRAVANVAEIMNIMLLLTATATYAFSQSAQN